MQHSTSADIDFSEFSIFISKVNHVFMEEIDKHVENVVIDEEELNGIEIDHILNLENLPRTMLESESSH